MGIWVREDIMSFSSKLKCSFDGFLSPGTIHPTSPVNDVVGYYPYNM